MCRCDVKVQKAGLFHKEMTLDLLNKACTNCYTNKAFFKVNKKIKTQCGHENKVLATLFLLHNNTWKKEQ